MSDMIREFTKRLTIAKNQKRNCRSHKSLAYYALTHIQNVVFKKKRLKDNRKRKRKKVIHLQLFMLLPHMPKILFLRKNDKEAIKEHRQIREYLRSHIEYLETAFPKPKEILPQKS